MIAQMKGKKKEFYRVWALNRVDLNIYNGKVMALSG
jgi:ABC-type sugar transport system ATPase subunit